MFFPIIQSLCLISRHVIRSKTNQVRNYTLISKYNSASLCKFADYNLISCRWKSKSRNLDKKMESEPETETEDLDEEIIDKNTKVLNVKLNSLRTDALLKTGLGMARNKIETLFYESKIRVNGKKILKKSVVVSPGDEIDIIKGISNDNPDLLVVARVEVVSVSEKDDKISVKLRRSKSLIVENYEDRWKG